MTVAQLNELGIFYMDPKVH